jgi:hypothetical protein
MYYYCRCHAAQWCCISCAREKQRGRWMCPCLPDVDRY